MKGIVIDKGEKYFTFLKKIFLSIDDIQKDYNWLITEPECYPQNKKYKKMLSEEYCFITGETLSDMVDEEDFQWIWGVFSAFKKEVDLGEILKYPFPQADGYKEIWSNPISIQHPLAELEIIAWDNSLTVFISKDDSIVDKLKKSNLHAKDLEEYNKI